MAGDSAPAQSARLEDDGCATIGRTLRAAREAMHLTEHAAAATLRMDPSILRALEGDDFSRLGAPVFVRGHLRNCAELLDLDAATLLEQYRQQVPGDQPPTPRARLREKFSVDDGFSLPLAALTVLVVALVSFAMWRLWSDEGEPLAVYSDIPLDALLPQDAEPWASGMQPVWLSADAASEVSAPAAGLLVSAVAVPDFPVGQQRDDTDDGSEPAASAGSVDAQGVGLVVTFSDECWTEITDAAGRRLFFGLARSGQHVTVHGSPPFDVLLGNARAAEFEVAGQPFPIPAARSIGGVARLTVDTP